MGRGSKDKKGAKGLSASPPPVRGSQERPSLPTSSSGALHASGKDVFDTDPIDNDQDDVVEVAGSQDSLVDSNSDEIEDLQDRIRGLDHSSANTGVSKPASESWEEDVDIFSSNLYRDSQLYRPEDSTVESYWASGIEDDTDSEKINSAKKSQLRRVSVAAGGVAAGAVAIGGVAAVSPAAFVLVGAGAVIAAAYVGYIYAVNSLLDRFFNRFFDGKE